MIERRWHPTQVLEELADGGVRLKMTVRGMNDAKRWVLGYCKTELVETIKPEIKSMYGHYWE
ncbi:MAG: WYL domain-containing protein [Pseudanabaenaceae cyanobacterium]